MLHALLLPPSELVKSVISISIIVTSSHHAVNCEASFLKHVIFQPNC